jgi:hypothetical protein
MTGIRLWIGANESGSKEVMSACDFHNNLSLSAHSALVSSDGETACLVAPQTLLKTLTGQRASAKVPMTTTAKMPIE